MQCDDVRLCSGCQLFKLLKFVSDVIDFVIVLVYFVCCVLILVWCGMCMGLVCVDVALLLLHIHKHQYLHVQILHKCVSELESARLGSDGSATSTNIMTGKS